MDVRYQAMSRGEELTGKWNTPWAYFGGGEKKKKEIKRWSSYAQMQQD